MENKELFIPYKKYDRLSFKTTALIGKIEPYVNAYNTERVTLPYDSMKCRARNIGDICVDYGAYDFARAMAVLEIAREGRTAGRVWGLSCEIAFNTGDIEFCREFAIRNARDGYSQKKYNPIKRESADENVADIMGMITDELAELEDDDYDELLEDFAAPLVQWRVLNVPKYKDGDAYTAMYEIVRLCYEHKAYHTALRLLALLYVTDKKNMPNLISTNLLAGKIMLELGYDEAAKNCFLLAARDNAKKRRPPFPEEYREFLEQETKLVIPKEVYEKQTLLDDDVASGKIKTYTKEEVDQYRDDKLKIELPDPKKIEKDRSKTGEMAIKAYEKHSGGDISEKLKGIDEAFKVFTEEPEVYEQAAYLYFMKANIYLEEDNLENALATIKKAYKCKNGRINGMVLLTFAIILSKMERFNEANIYIFRTFILFGKEFIAEKLGEGALEAIEDYL